MAGYGTKWTKSKRFIYSAGLKDKNDFTISNSDFIKAIWYQYTYVRVSHAYIYLYDYIASRYRYFERKQVLQYLGKLHTFAFNSQSIYIIYSWYGLVTNRPTVSFIFHVTLRKTRLKRVFIWKYKLYVGPSFLCLNFVDSPCTIYFLSFYNYLSLKMIGVFIKSVQA